MLARAIIMLIIVVISSAVGHAGAQPLAPANWSNDCQTPWGTIVEAGQSVTAYQAEGCPGACVSEVRTCAGNALSGSYTVEACPSIGADCGDGTVYAGASGGNDIFAAHCDEGKTWNGSNCTGTASSLQWMTTNGTGSGFASTSDGVANTNTLVSNGIANFPAGQACRSHGANWYLPALDELSLLCANKAEIGGFSGSHWSSTANAGMSAAIQVLGNCGTGGTNKTTSNIVRCVHR
jgi:hypothetical protein